MNTLAFLPFSASSATLAIPFNDPGGGTEPTTPVSAENCSRASSISCVPPGGTGAPSEKWTSFSESIGDVAMPVAFLPTSVALFMAWSPRLLAESPFQNAGASSKSVPGMN